MVPFFMSPILELLLLTLFLKKPWIPKRVLRLLLRETILVPLKISGLKMVQKQYRLVETIYTRTSLFPWTRNLVQMVSCSVGWWQQAVAHDKPLS